MTNAEHTSLRHSLGKATELLTGNVGMALVLLANGILTARALGPEHFGALGVLLGFSSFLQAFLSIRTTETLSSFLLDPRYVTGELSRVPLIRVSVWGEVISKLLAAALLPLLVLSLAPVQGQADLQLICGLISATILLQAPEPVWLALERHLLHYRSIATLPLVYSCAQTFATVFLFTHGALDLQNAALILVCAATIKAIILSARLRYLLVQLASERDPPRFWPRPSDFLSLPRDYWSFLAARFFQTTLTGVLKNLDGLLSGLLLSLDQVGLYRVARGLSNVPLLPLNSFALVIYRDFAATQSQSSDRILTLKLIRLSLYALLISVAILGVGAMFASTVIRLAYGSEYESAALGFNVLLAGNLVALVVSWAPVRAVAIRETALVNRITLISLIAFLAPLPLITTWSATVVAGVTAFAWSLHHVLFAVAAVRSTRRQCDAP